MVQKLLSSWSSKKSWTADMTASSVWYVFSAKCFFNVGEQKIVRWCQIRGIYGEWSTSSKPQTYVQEHCPGRGQCSWNRTSHCKKRKITTDRAGGGCGGRDFCIFVFVFPPEFQNPRKSAEKSHACKTLFVKFSRPFWNVSSTTFQSSELLIQCGFIWKGTMQLVSGKVESNACQVSLLWHNSFLVSLWTFQPTPVPVWRHLMRTNIILCTGILYSPYGLSFITHCSV